MTATPGWVQRIADPVERTIARFKLKVRICPATGCWLWTAATDDDGYGTFQYAGRDGSGKREKRRAHRVAWELFVGPLPADLLVMHKCDTPACVNPEHLRLGTHQDNVADRCAKGRSAVGDAHGRQTRPDAFKRANRRVRTVTVFLRRAR